MYKKGINNLYYQIMWRIPPIFLAVSIFTFSIGSLFDHHFIEGHPHHSHLISSPHHHNNLNVEHSHYEIDITSSQPFFSNDVKSNVFMSLQIEIFDLFNSLPHLFLEKEMFFKSDSFFVVFFKVSIPPPII